MSIDPSKVTQLIEDLDNARKEAAWRLSALKEAERLVRDRRRDFDHARRLAARSNKRHRRYIGKN